jgi:hypothetical protein
VLAVTDYEFERMLWTEADGYGKPTLTIRAGVLHVENVPPRRHTRYLPSERVLAMTERLSVYELAAALGRRLRMAVGHAQRDAQAEAVARGEIEKVALRVVAELRTLADAAQSDLVLIHLPLDEDCRGFRRHGWWSALAPKVEALGVNSVDLTEACRGLSEHDVDDLFFQDDSDRGFGTVGHYTEKGNQWFGLALYERLRPIIDRRLALGSR